MVDIVLNFESQLSALQGEINQLVEDSRLDSIEVYQLSVEIDKLISDYYKNYYQRV